MQQFGSSTRQSADNASRRPTVTHVHPVSFGFIEVCRPLDTIEHVEAHAVSVMRHLLRAFAVVAVLFGVMLMHSLPAAHPAAHPGGAHTGSAAHAVDIHAQSHEVSGTVLVRDAGVSPADAVPCGGDCGAHAGMQHLCVAVLTVVAALIVVWSWSVSPITERHLEALASWFRRHPGRAPPWTTPTLAQLSVLRV